MFLFGVDPRPPGNGRNFKRKFTNEGDFPSCPLPPLWPPSVSDVATETAAREERKFPLRFSRDSFLRVSSPARCMGPDFSRVSSFFTDVAFQWNLAARHAAKRHPERKSQRKRVFPARSPFQCALVFNLDPPVRSSNVFSLRQSFSRPFAVPSPSLRRSRKKKCAFLTFSL